MGECSGRVGVMLAFTLNARTQSSVFGNGVVNLSVTGATAEHRKNAGDENKRLVR